MPQNKQPSKSWATVTDPKKPTPAAQATKSQEPTRAQTAATGSASGKKDQQPNPENDTVNNYIEAEQFRKEMLLDKGEENIMPPAVTTNTAAIVEGILRKHITDAPSVAASPTPPQEVESKTESNPIDKFLALAQDEIKTANNNSSILIGLQKKALNSDLLKNSNNAEKIYSLLIQSAVQNFHDERIAATLSDMAIKNNALSKQLCKKMIQLTAENGYLGGINCYFEHMVKNKMLNDDDILFIMCAYETCNPTNEAEKIHRIDNAWILYANYLSPKNKCESIKSHQLIMEMVRNNTDIIQAYLLSYAIRAYENLISTGLIDENTVALMFDIANHYNYIHQGFLEDLYTGIPEIPELRGIPKTSSLDTKYASLLKRHQETLECDQSFYDQRALQFQNRDQYTKIREQVYKSWRPNASPTPIKTNEIIAAAQTSHTQFMSEPTIRQPVQQQYHPIQPGANLSSFATNNVYSMFQQPRAPHSGRPSPYQPPNYYQPPQSRW